MSLSVDLFPLWFLIVGFVIWTSLTVWAIYRANWQVLNQNQQAQTIFFALIVALSVLWLIRAGLSPGLGIHFMALTMVTLLVSWPLAIVIGNLALIAQCFIGTETWITLGVNGVVTVILPIATSWWVYLWVSRHLPANPFVYIFLCGFFNGAIAITGVVCTFSLLLGGLDVYSWLKVYEEFFIYLPLLLFPEAFINGIIVAGLVGFAPEWLASFDQDEFFRD